MSVAESSVDPHRALRDDVRLLGELLGETLRRQEGQPLFERVERVRALAKRTRVSSADGFETLADELRAMPVESALPIARSFAHFLNLANVAEQHHRVRRRRAYQRDPRARPQPASIEEALPRLLSGGVSPDALHRAVCSLGIELVVTAHPTEIMRRSLQHKYRRIADALADLDHSDVTCLERETLVETMRREITAAWETEEVRRERPSPLDEVRSALAVFEETLWDALPLYCRSLDRTLRQSHRPRPADRRGADPVRLVDRRRSRRQPVRHPGSDAQRLPDGALDRAVALRERDRAAAIRAVDVGRDRRAARRRSKACTSPTGRSCARCSSGSTRRDATSKSCCGRRRDAPPALRRRAGFTWEPEMFEPVVGAHRAAPALPPLAARHRQRHHRRRPADRRPPPPGGVRRDARAARRAPGSRAAHRGRRCDHARARPRRVRVLDRRAARRFPRQRAHARPQADAAADADERPRRGSPRDVPHDGGGPSRVARRLRDHDGREARRTSWRSSCCSARPA